MMNANLHKYPRTPHLPWSPGIGRDDVTLIDTSRFEGREVVITEKMDGENTSLYTDGMHARSLDSAHHPSRDWVRALLGRIAHEIPEGWRICGENLFARHSIAYDTLDSYFYVFSIWNDKNECLSWQQTSEWSDLLGLDTVPVIYEGIWDKELAKNLELDEASCEGYVVRDAGAFAYDDFSDHMGKWVRQGHVQTDSHWMYSKIVPNGLSE